MLRRRHKMAENKVFDSIMNGLNESLAYAKGDTSNARKMSVTVAELPRYHDKEIKQIREDLNLKQRNFAFLLGVSAKRVEAGASGRSILQGTAQRFLQVLRTGGKKLLQDYNVVAVTM